jgi:hypothetical protein
MEIKAALSAAIAIAAFTLLIGCSSTQKSLESEPGAESQNFPEGYDVIYQRLAAMGERCYPRGRDRGYAGNLLAGAIESQGEVHKESGIADFRLVTSTWDIKTNYFLAAKIEKMGSGSRVTTKVNNPMISSGLSKIIFRWAAGDQNC